MIEVSDLSKSFRLAKQARKKEEHPDPRKDGKWFHALKNISFTVDKGHILGLLGPNGAGKTTLLRLLSTSLKPTGGTARIMGVELSENPIEIRKKIGFLSGNTGLYARLTPREMVAYYGSLHGMTQNQIAERTGELFKTLNMESYADRRNSTLSAGMKQKVSIARTLIHDPEVVVLDEPTTGLDVSAAEHILSLIEEFRQRGRIVLFSTHHMHEVERLCDSIVMIVEGEKCFSGTVAEMKSHGTNLDKAFLELAGEGVDHV